MNDVKHITQMGKHEAGEGDKMQAGQGFGKALVIAGESPETGHPAEAALDDRAAR